MVATARFERSLTQEVFRTPKPTRPFIGPVSSAPDFDGAEIVQIKVGLLGVSPMVRCACWYPVPVLCASDARYIQRRSARYGGFNRVLRRVAVHMRHTATRPRFQTRRPSCNGLADRPRLYLAALESQIGRMPKRLQRGTKCSSQIRPGSRDAGC